MKSLWAMLQDTATQGIALGHFNISDLVALKAVFNAAYELKVPVLIGTSEGEREFIGPRQAVALVKSLRDEYAFPIFINADHTHSLEKAREAAEAGYDEILFDGSALELEENIRQTKQAVETIKSVNPAIVVEGEIGYIGSSSEIVASRPAESFKLTTPEEAKQFVAETGVDVLAPAVGTMHGLLIGMAEGREKKRLDVERVRQIKESTGSLLTLHGGSGTAEEDFISAIHAGINIIHINTELRLAWRKGMEEGLQKNQQEIAPYKIYPEALGAIQHVVLKRLKLFTKPS